MTPGWPFQEQVPMTPTKLPQGLTEPMLQGWLTDNPGQTPEQGIQEFLLHTSRQTGRSLGEVIREAYSGIAQPVTEAVGEGVGRFFQGMVPGSGKRFSDPAEGYSQMAGQMIAEAAIPQTPEALALGLATGPVSRIGAGAVGAGQKMLAAGKRVGAMGGVGGATAAVTGGDPTEGALMGAGGQLVGGEGMRAAQNFRSLARSVVTRRRSLNQSAQDANLALQGLLQDVPGFTHPASGITGMRGQNAQNVLFRLQERGPRALSAHFQRADDEVVRAMGKVEVAMPSYYVRRGIPPGASPPLLSVKDALEELKRATAAAIRAPKGAEGWAMRDSARQSREEVLNAIRLRDPGVATMYEREAGNYARGLVAVHALRDSGAFQGATRSGTGATFNAVKFLEHMGQNMDSMGPQRMPSTWKSLLRGAQPGATEVTGTVKSPRVYFGGGVSETGPLVTYTRESLGGNARTPLTKLSPISAYIAANEMSGGYLEP